MGTFKLEANDSGSICLSDSILFEILINHFDIKIKTQYIENFEIVIKVNYF